MIFRDISPRHYLSFSSRLCLHGYSWRHSLSAFCPVYISSVGASELVEQYLEAVADEDYAGKKKSVQRMASGGEDTAIYPILLKALNDRQTEDTALKSLMARSGLSRPKGGEGPGFPGFPTSDDAIGWGKWWQDRKAKEAEDARLAELGSKAQRARRSGGPDCAG